MKVVLIDKQTKVRTVLQKGLSESEAESICEAWGWNYIDENGKSFWLEYGEEQEEMTEKAKKVWKVAIDHGIETAVEYAIDDLEAFAAGMDGKDEQEILNALNEKIMEATH